MEASSVHDQLSCAPFGVTGVMSFFSSMRMPLGSVPDVSPIFIVGMGRSGTTLLQLALNMHPRFAILGETQAFLERRRYGSFQRPSNLEQFLSEWRVLLRDGPHAGLLHDPEIKRRLVNCANYAEAMNEVMQMLARGEGKSTWGEKTPAHIFKLNSIRSCFPDARILHMIRDPRGAVSSSVQFQHRGGFTDWNIYAAARYWSRCLEIHDRELRDGNPNYFSLHYEDLINRGEQTLREICKFLQVDFYPGMLEFHRCAKSYVPKDLEGRVVRHHVLTQSPLDPSRGEAWRTLLSPHQVAIIESCTAKQMINNGYSPTEAGRLPVERNWDSPWLEAQWAASECKRLGTRLSMDVYWAVRHLVARREAC
jgi:hypothetical protein